MLHSGDRTTFLNIPSARLSERDAFQQFYASFTVCAAEPYLVCDIAVSISVFAVRLPGGSGCKRCTGATLPSILWVNVASSNFKYRSRLCSQRSPSRTTNSSHDFQLSSNCLELSASRQNSALEELIR